MNTKSSPALLALVVASAHLIAPTLAQPSLPNRVEVAPIGLCAFAPDQVPILVDTLVATGRGRVGVKFLSQSFGGYERATHLVQDYLGRATGSLIVSTYLDDGPNRRQVRAWFRPNLAPSGFWDRCADNDGVFLSAFRQALVEPYRTWVTQQVAWATQRGMAHRVAFVCIPVLEDDADLGRDAASARRAYVNLLNACVAGLSGTTVAYCRNPVVADCLVSRVPGFRLASRAWVGLELHGNRSAIGGHLIAGDGWGNDGAFVSYRGEAWIGTPGCDSVLTVAAWRSTVLAPALAANASPSYWHPAFNGHWPVANRAKPQDRGTLRPFTAAPQLASAIRSAIAR